ncbi:cell surface protein, putative [Trichomonas vaginalis G3]|uniref:Cell surface protein, putative n=1 Tax=Trichomonas vaginalis (strain ATCC PRA-98 / G3) TaxID=412133 RepID=A2E5S1_TRIV3|nr:ribonuclease inhibitor domain-containing protein [Trichomonas vaginalis G3]EAY11991.1 cell surface protein, putative [Trichomonas vaginalis G3]KAI5524834.1 ribonuclease inhibitor domain-containing protein [Trichomonas vaginalis G3]|eukprot:XP_001324214.1 cell surface protein [Trichomonas vaginalis G3]
MEEHSFRRCPNLISVDLSCTLITKISYCLFARCNKLTTIIMPPFITSISELSFTETNLDELVIPAGVSSVEKNAFNNCSITNIYYCGVNTINSAISTENEVSIIVSRLYPSSSSTFLGFNIVNRKYECSVTPCILMTDQLFMKCPSEYQFRMYFSALLYLVTFIINK